MGAGAGVEAERARLSASASAGLSAVSAVRSRSGSEPVGTTKPVLSAGVEADVSQSSMATRAAAPMLAASTWAVRGSMPVMRWMSASARGRPSGAMLSAYDDRRAGLLVTISITSLPCSPGSVYCSTIAFVTASERLVLSGCERTAAMMRCSRSAVTAATIACSLLE